MRLVEIGTVTRREGKTRVELREEYRKALEGLSEFSHCHVLWWSGSDFGMGIDTRAILGGELPYAPGHSSGVFANRSPFRPNLIAMTVCPILSVEVASGFLELAAIDALEGTSVLDIKPYYGSCDRVRASKTPSWLPDWGEWFPEGGIGLED